MPSTPRLLYIRKTPDSDDFGLTYFVIATPDLIRGKQSRAVTAHSGLPRGFAARNDDSIRCHHGLA
ncbi:MAG: hypothetical protein WA910_11705, partial [Sphingopyxis granuli]